MTLTLLLYWFPIFLGVAVGTTLLGGLPRPRGAALAVICAIFWVALVQSNVETPFWRTGGMLLATLAGAGAIVLMGLCGPEISPAASASARPSERALPASGSVSPDHAGDMTVTPVAAALRQFEAWLEAHRHQDDPWPDFDEFIRGMIYQWVGGTHVRTYRIVDSGDHLVPLREVDSDGPAESLPARLGLVGYIATTGRSYLAGDSTQGDLIDHLAARMNPQTGKPAGNGCEAAGPAWCFAISRRNVRAGVVVVGSLRRPSGPAGHAHGRAGVADGAHREHVRLAELLVGQFWNSLTEVCRSRAAVTIDPGSGVLTRGAFFEVGDEALAEAYRRGEPAAVGVLALEGVRGLDDDGKWDAADDVRAMCSGVLKQRMRTDDRVGRFDDSRFVVLLRRVDSELALLIMRELMTQLEAVMRARKPSARQVGLRCGLAGTGVSAETPDHQPPTLRALVATAIGACGEARRTSVAIASDLNLVKSEA